ncbi:MAG TPA: isoprenylcysteine carboxylmethyltransferase family protein [Bacteroidales bacterium]|nr:isoprenylcysteine carboxylmethyltransferase family protein [Bacteroidales bacterium]
MDIIGKPSINPILFFSGKICGYLTWTALLLCWCNIEIVDCISFSYNQYISVAVYTIGFAFGIISIFNLGSSTRFGLPTEQTVFKTNGLYRISRNPMYLGFDLMTLSAMIGTLNVIIALLGLYSILIYHFIILAEEKFLERSFGEEYLNYKRKTRRYF